MPTVNALTLSAGTLKRLAALAVGDFHSIALPRPDGLFDVPVTEETAERVELHRFEGESDDQVISRVLDFQAQGGQAN
jgi:hypothetical protein